MHAKARKTSAKRTKAKEVREQNDLLPTLKARFEEHVHRHQGLQWEEVEARLEARPAAVRSLQQMEDTGGEPDVVGRDEQTGELLFVDCSAESPAGRRSLCYDPAALASRKEHKPKDSACGMAAAMGVEILTEDQYRALQRLGEFDLKTSSWLGTPAAIRTLGGAIFGDRRYGAVFVYHNGAESYYAARGFRAALKV
jgi:hypothetical protein